MRHLTRLSAVALALSLGLTAGCSKKKNPAEADVLDYYAAYMSEFYNVPVKSSTAFDLKGTFETPSVSTSGLGTTSFVWQSNSLQYEIDLLNMNGVTGANIYLGAVGTNGALAAHMFSGPTTGAVNGPLVAGTIEPDDLVGMPWDDFIDACYAGRAYVNVLTTNLPTGELRGQTARTGKLDLTYNVDEKYFTWDLYLQPGYQITPGTLGIEYFLSPSSLNTSGIEHVELVGTPKVPDANGLFGQGTFSATDIQGATLEQFLSALNSGNLGVIFKTAAEPDGELRGQVLQKE